MEFEVNIPDLKKEIINSYCKSHNILTDENFHKKLEKTMNSYLETAEALEMAIDVIPDNIVEVRNKGWQFLFDHPEAGIDRGTLLKDKEVFEGKVLPVIRDSIVKIERIIEIYRGGIEGKFLKLVDGQGDL